MPLVLPRRGGQKRDQEDEVDAFRKDPWKEIEDTVRTFDEDKVKGCTEDVDALLVFAGLYSAVLTAFLIESYKKLFADESESLLRQMVLQTANYRFDNGYLNTTFDTSRLPTFNAAVSDIRVNVCWFASLILSLSCASLGIAVKQWLREFLVIDCINPRERLRIRNARIHGLADWKLFQIAAFLPILLQISLALFFVGLCFFTAAVHRSIGITSLFLVSCWAFLFFSSIIAPLFSPRCPYKTTLLKAPFRYARPHIRSFLSIVYRGLATLFAWINRNMPTVNRSKGGQDAANTESKRTQGPSEVFLWYETYMDLGVIHKLSPRVFREDTVSREEDTLRSMDSNDAVIFCNVDATFLDDGLLESMCQTLVQRLDPLSDMLQFVSTVLQRRSGFSLAEATTENTRNRQAWPWSLSQAIRTTLADTLAQSMEDALYRMSSLGWLSKTSGNKDSEWTGSLIFLIPLVASREVIPNSITRLFQRFSEYCATHHRDYFPLEVFSYQMRTMAQSDPDWPARSLLFLAQSLEKLKFCDAEIFLRYIAHTNFVRPGRPWDDTYRRLLQPSPDDKHDDVLTLTPQRMFALLEVARVLLHNYILEQTQGRDQFPEQISELLEFVFNSIPKLIPQLNLAFHEPITGPRDGPGLYRVLGDLFTTPYTTRSLLHFFATHPCQLSRSHDHWSFLDIIPSSLSQASDNRGEIEIISLWTAFFVSQTSASEESFVVDSAEALLGLCLLVYRYSISGNNEVAACRKKLFDAVSACYQSLIKHKHHSSCEFACRYADFDEHHTDTCEMAYTILDYHETHNVYGFPNEMVRFLRSFVCEKHTLNRQGQTLYLIECLAKFEAAGLEIQSSRRSDKQSKTEPTELESEIIAVKDTIPTIPTHSGSPDDQLNGGPDASAGEDPIPSNLEPRPLPPASVPLPDYATATPGAAWSVIT